MKRTARQTIVPMAFLPCLLPLATSASVTVTSSYPAGSAALHTAGVISPDVTCRQSGAAIAPNQASGRVHYLTNLDPGYGGSIDTSTGGSIDHGYGGPIDPGYGGSVDSGSTDSGYGGSIDTGYGGPINLSVSLTTLQTSRVRNSLDQAQAHTLSLRTNEFTRKFGALGIASPEANVDTTHATADPRFNVYLIGGGDFLGQDGSLNDSAFKARTTTVSVGADYRYSDSLVLGGSIGLFNSHVSFSGSTSDQTSKGNQAGAYAMWNLTSASYVSATLNYEASRFSVTRDSGEQQNAFSSPRGHGLGISLMGGRDFASGPWSFGPYIRVDSVESSIDAFDETGGASALSVGAQRVRSNSVNIGAQTQFAVPVSWGIVLPYVRVELSHRSDATKQAPSASLLSDNTTLLIPTPADTSSGFGNVAIGVSGVNRGGLSWFADFEAGLAQKGYSTQRIGLGIRREL